MAEIKGLQVGYKDTQADARSLKAQGVKGGLLQIDQSQQG